MKRALLMLSLIASALMVTVSSAGAAWQHGADPASVSLERLEQANASSSFPEISDDGKYVVFETRATNLFPLDDPDPEGFDRAGGIFRSEVATGQIELVADGNLLTEGTTFIVTRGARSPSISADGRYVAFSTGYQLVPADTNTQLDVYVRDMSVPIRSAGAFELVSSKDGGDVPAFYTGSSTNTGAIVPAGGAISSDGNKVLFQVNAASDLPNSLAADTPAFQLYVRDRIEKTTTLVTRNLSDGGPAGGVLNANTAELSADGTTVAWTGQNASAQTPFFSGEFPADSDSFYLWRRLADGPTAPTRRVTGGVDPDDPDCPQPWTIQPSQTALGPCYGPLTQAEGIAPSDITARRPVVSADGRRVAFLTSANLRPNLAAGNFLDVYVTDMPEGVSRKQGTIELTRDPSGNDVVSGSPITGIALSGDGRWLVLVTNRIKFQLPILSFVGDPSVEWDVAELYVVDLERFEIERAVRGIDRSEVNGGVADTASISADGNRIAFISAASNLFPGDLNNTPDAFVVSRRDSGEGEQGTVDEVAGLGDVRAGGASVKKRLALGVKRLTGGRLRVQVRVPEAGALSVRATASVPSRRARRSRTRTLGRASAKARAAGTETLVLKLSRRYLARMSARKRKRIKARLLVSFVPSARGESLRLDRVVTIKR
jgi:Tol biopolymer transport system component